MENLMQMFPQSVPRMLSAGEQGFALPFEAVSILLLAAMIGCIVIAMKSKPEEK